MTTIAWDGEALAVDSRITVDGMVRAGRKARRLRNGDVLAVFGDYTGALFVMQWYARGADPTAWPTAQQLDDQCGELIVVRGGRVLQYATSPVPQEIRESRMAWGSGKGYALGAMAMGADARQAVAVAARYDPQTGGRIHVYRGR